MSPKCGFFVVEPVQHCIKVLRRSHVEATSWEGLCKHTILIRTPNKGVTMSPDDQIIFALGRLSTVLRAGEWQSGAGLSPAQAEILRRVALRPMRQAGLAAHLGVSAASVSDSVSALVAKGLVERLPDPADGRAILIHPTDVGRKLAAERHAAPDALREALAALAERRRAALLDALVQLIRSLQDSGAIPLQRMCVSCRHFRPYAHADAARPHHCAFVDAAFGTADLRLDCGEHEAAIAEEAAANWRTFDAAEAGKPDAPPAATGEAPLLSTLTLERQETTPP
jgi:DNA-binding MarR family transcriptional regulator